jgi:hypothetical protein
MKIKGWVQVYSGEPGELFFPENVFGNKLPAEFAPKKSLLTWEATRNGTIVRPATLIIDDKPKRGGKAANGRT